jgi:hypothetical protein
MLSKRDRILQLFRPDSHGVSHWVQVDELEPAGIGWTKNGNLRRGVAFGFDEVVWQTRRIAGPRSEVTALRMAGWNKNQAFKQTIRSDIKNAFGDVTHCNLSCLPIPKQDREIDHRFGNKSHPDYVALYASANQKIEDFQLTHRALNLQKRQMCVKCIETGERPAHPELGYAEGDANHATRFPCRGCYLAEPERFRR